MLPSPFSRLPGARGFSLVELMVAMALGLVVLGAMATLFVSNTKAQMETEKANRQIENGRYAVQTLSGDAYNAGYYGEFDPTPLAAPPALPAPCAVLLAELRSALPLPVQGADNVSTGELPCLDDVREGTDVLVVRRVQTCLLGTGSCEDASAGGAFFQASLCSNATELESADAGDFYDLDTSLAMLTRHKRDCTSTANSGTPADVRRFVTHIYFIANNDVAGDAIPTMKRAELGGTDNALSFVIVPLAEGVEDLQLEYGMDIDADSAPELYSADPATANGCAMPDCALSNWRSVVAIKLNLLARNTEQSAGHRDIKSYRLGNNAAGAAISVGPFNDAYKRHVFQSTVHLPNPAGRRLP